MTAVKRILRRRRGKGRAVRVGLFAKELYKIFVMERAWLLLLLFALLQWNSYREIPFYGNPYDQYYYSYVIKAEGLPLEEAAAVYQRNMTGSRKRSGSLSASPTPSTPARRPTPV